MNTTWIKSPKVLLTGALLLAFAAGALVEGFTRWGVTKAFTEPTPTTATDPAPIVSTPAVNPAATRFRPAASAPVTTVSSEPRPVHRKRSWQQEALIIGGSSAAGAAIGAVAGGGKGAAIGALSGGAAGTIYDVATRNK